MRAALITGLLTASLIAGCSAATPAAVPSVSALPPSSEPATTAPTATGEPTATVVPTAAPTVAPTPLWTPPPDPLTITGTIRDSAGNPVAGAYLGASLESASGSTYFGTSVPTKDDGRYRLHVDAPGTYRLSVGAPLAPDLGFTTSKTCRWDRPCEKVVVGGSPLVIDVALPKFSTVSGVVLDKNGRPLPGVEVFGGTRGDPIMGSASTDDRGRFSVLALPGTTYVGFNMGIKELLRLKVRIGTKDITNLKVKLPAKR